MHVIAVANPIVLFRRNDARIVRPPAIDHHDGELHFACREELSRAVILCAFHDKKNVHRNIDVIELDALCEELRNL